MCEGGERREVHVIGQGVVCLCVRREREVGSERVHVKE